MIGTHRQWWAARASLASALAFGSLTGTTAMAQQTASVQVVRESGEQPFRYQAPTTAVAPGASVTWSNPRIHTTGAAEDHPTNCRQGTSKGKCPWSSEPLPPGGNFTVAFPEEGTFTYFCAVHPYMEGTIVVGDGDPAPASSPSPTPTTSASPSPRPSTTASPSASPSPTASSSSAPSAPSATPTPGTTPGTTPDATASPTASPSTIATSDATTTPDQDTTPTPTPTPSSTDAAPQSDLEPGVDPAEPTVPRGVATVLVLGTIAATVTTLRRRS